MMYVTCFWRHLEMLTNKYQDLPIQFVEILGYRLIERPERF